MTVEQDSHEWWKVYGPFEAGEGMMPHFGNVVRWYREQQGRTIDELAHTLGISKVRAYALEESRMLPKNMRRRELLTQMLHIPPALLALPLVEVMVDEKPSVGGIAVLDPRQVQTYEDILTLSWHAYYTSGAHLALGLVTNSIGELDDILPRSRGVASDQLCLLKSRLLQLQSVIERDQLHLNHSLRTSSDAIALAQHVGNPDVLASALFRRARTYLQANQTREAKQDSEEACHIASAAHDLALRAYVRISWCEIHASVMPHDTSVQRQCLAVFDDVAKSVRVSRVNVLEGEGTRVDLPGVLMERANALRRFGMLSDAQDMLDVVRDTLGPNLTRWQGNLGIAEAQLCLAHNDIDGACLVANETLTIVRTTRSRGNEAKIKEIFRDASRREPQRSSVHTLGNALGGVLL